MERLLWLYSLPLDARFPVVCFDERPCFLIGDTVAALSMKAGSVLKEHYEYEKNGSCALLAAIEPKTGTRLAAVYDQRTKREYALFLKDLAAQYSTAEKIRLVQDNLNTQHKVRCTRRLPLTRPLPSHSVSSFITRRRRRRGST